MINGASGQRGQTADSVEGPMPGMRPAPFLPRSTPADEGVDPAGVAAFRRAIADAEPQALMIARNGRVIEERWWEPYRPDSVRLVYSLSKTFTATAIGLLVDEGEIGLTDRIVDHLPVDPAAVDPAWHAVLVEHCLSMTVGHTADGWAPTWRLPLDDSADGGLLAAVLGRPPQAPPGSLMVYNQIATYLLSRAISAITGQRVSEFLRPRLFEPLGTPQVRWETDGADPARGNDLGFTGLRVDIGTVLSLAQVYADDGRWRGEQLLPADWVRRATEPYLPMPALPDSVGDWERGYGFSFWQCRHGYRGDGAFGQLLLVLPAQRITLAMYSETTEMQSLLNAVWDHLLPAVDRPSASDRPADPDPVGEVSHPSDSGAPAPLGRLHRVIASPAEAVSGSELPERFTGGELRAAEGGWQLILDDATGPLPAVAVGARHWAESVLQTGGRRISLAGRGGVGADGSWRAALVLVGTPHRISATIGPDRDLSLHWRMVPLNGADPVDSADLG